MENESIRGRIQTGTEVPGLGLFEGTGEQSD